VKLTGILPDASPGAGQRFPHLTMGAHINQRVLNANG